MKDELRNPKVTASEGGRHPGGASVVEQWCFAGGETPPQPAGEDACATLGSGMGGLLKIINPENKSLREERAFPLTPALSLGERENLPPTHKKTTIPVAVRFQGKGQREWPAVEMPCATKNCFTGLIQVP